MSLFGHLALRFGSQPENLATEALSYLLGRSANARRGFLASLGRETLPYDLAFTTQHSTKDRGRPDLAGTDDAGDVRVLVEAKFWAGFTEHQPVGYIDQLPIGGVMVVICPSARTVYVWRELLNRLRLAKREVTEMVVSGEVGRATVDDKYLVLQSWARAVNAIRLELVAEPEVLADALQLDGLCARMAAEAFIPMTSEELTSNVFRRVHEFGKIVDDVVHPERRGDRQHEGDEGGTRERLVRALLESSRLPRSPPRKHLEVAPLGPESGLAHAPWQSLARRPWTHEETARVLCAREPRHRV